MFRRNNRDQFNAETWVLQDPQHRAVCEDCGERFETSQPLHPYKAKRCYDCTQIEEVKKPTRKESVYARR